MAQRVRSDALGDPGATGDPAHDPPGGVTAKSRPGGLDEDRTIETVANGQVDGSWGEWHRGGPSALADHRQRAMPPLQAERVDVGADRLGHAQPVQRKQRHQCMIPRRREAGGDQHGAELVAIEVGDLGLVVNPWPTDVHCRRMFDGTFVLGVAVEPDERAQPPSDGRPSLAAIFEITGEAFDVHAADLEQMPVVLPAPGRELGKSNM
jgi:hypothetical protein